MNDTIPRLKRVNNTKEMRVSSFLRLLRSMSCFCQQRKSRPFHSPNRRQNSLSGLISKVDYLDFLKRRVFYFVVNETVKSERQVEDHRSIESISCFDLALREDSKMAANKAEELLPIDRAVVYFERAKQLSIFSSGTSLELERLLREIFKALSYNNKEPIFFLLLGKIYKLNLDITSAMFCYRFILKQNQSLLAARKFLIELLVLKGKEYMDMGLKMKWKAKFTAARSCFDEALEYNRENYDLWIMKSVCHVHCGELPEAFEAISKVIRPNRELDAEIYILRAKINWGRGLTEQGNQDIRFAASINSNHPEVLGFIARSYARSELLYKEALNAFTQEKGKFCHKF